ncbi:DUF86 domain-containing protein [Paenibacillus sp.]|uniref:DUF86 domain-containing protein n=1 Tax=Paenibacillus sp. TaxID=58172 RepID=UPI002D52CEF8|nr:HepT-like ribonuclease domain-containing protein [Paenibacillus sp.]HZG57742.1 HepT-like ribonuclease domain-containing protein [Paenibacillus sp.]
MYYVNREQIDARLRFVPTVARALRALAAGAGAGNGAAADASDGALLTHFAQERALHLAIEAVTDVGSFLIDGFMMRDASSYEDIVDILRTEGVLPDDVADGLRALVALRRPLTQEYMELRRDAPRDDLERTAELLETFPPLVRAFIEKELQPFA